MPPKIVLPQKKRVISSDDEDASQAPDAKAVRAANGDDPVANGLGIVRRLEESKDMSDKIDTVQVRVDALLDQRLRGMAHTIKELAGDVEKIRNALKRVDGDFAAFKPATEALLKRHEAICKTSYWAVQRLREQSVLPQARTAGEAAVAASLEPLPRAGDDY